MATSRLLRCRRRPRPRRRRAARAAGGGGASGGGAYGTIAPFPHDAPTPPARPALLAAGLRRATSPRPSARRRPVAITVDGLPLPRRRRSAPRRAACGSSSTNRGRLAHTFRVERKDDRSSPRSRACCPATATARPFKRPQGRVPLLLRALQPRGARHVRHADRQVRAVEPDRFRAVMGHFATGVAVVTVDAPGGPAGHDRQRGRVAEPRPRARARLLRQRRAHAPRGRARQALRRQRARRRPGGPRAPLRLQGGLEVRRGPAQRPRRHPGARRRARVGRLRPRALRARAATTRSGSAPSTPPSSAPRGSSRWSGSAAPTPRSSDDRASTSCSASRVVVVNLAAGLLGAYKWHRDEYSRAFWPLLRTGQALVVIEVIQGGVLLLLGEELPPPAPDLRPRPARRRLHRGAAAARFGAGDSRPARRLVGARARTRTTRSTPRLTFSVARWA